MYRIYYSNGFWGDEIASSRSSAIMKGEDIAKASGVLVTRVVKVKT